MNPLYVLGWCETRDHGELRPRRETVQFLGTVQLSDDRRRRTVVELGPEATAQVTLGKNTPASVVYDTGGGTKQYVYDETGGSWFGLGQAFGGTNGFYIRTELDPGDSISVQGFAPRPIMPRKFLLNLGPDSITVQGHGSSSTSSPGMVLGAAIKAVPNTGLKIFWDSVSLSWRVIQPPDWRTLQFSTLITVQSDRLVIKGWPVVLPADAAAPPGPLPNQIAVAGELVVHKGEPVIVTPG